MIEKHKGIAIGRLNKNIKIILKKIRPASNPYISGDGFRRIADHIYDETNQTIDPATVKNGDIIFIATQYLGLFFSKALPTLKNRVKLITHNSDLPADKQLTSCLNDKIEVWFAQNNTYKHPRVIPIPIGLENRYHFKNGRIIYFNQLRKLTINKKNKILFGFNVKTNPKERENALQYAIHSKYMEELWNWPSPRQYLFKLSNYKFVLAPPGNGLDTHRAWEAMYTRVVPIVKSSVAMRYFQNLGLPIWVIDDWDDLDRIDNNILEEKYVELENGFESKELFMRYWRNRIHNRNL